MPSLARVETVKFRNLAATFKTIRERGPISRTAIAKLLRLNRSTISRLVDQLMALGLVVEGAEIGPSTRRGGRRPVALELNPEAGYLIGLDLSGTNLNGGLADLNGEIIVRCQGPAHLVSDGGGEENLRRLIEQTQGLVQACPDPLRIWGVGIGAPAVTLYEEGVVTWAPALGWRDLPLKQMVEQAVGLPVFVENDANLAALGEHWRGAGQGVNDLVAIFIGTGIGAGIVWGGELYRGAHQAAGEVGYMVVNTECLGQRYDRFGCLETLASGPGIAARAKEHIKAGEGTTLLALAGRDVERVTAETVFEAARQGDAVAGTVVDETIQYLSLAVANVSCLLNPEMIIFGGGVARSADLLLDGIRQQVDGVIPVVPRLVTSALGKDAIIQGAFAMVLRQVSEVNWRIP